MSQKEKKKERPDEGVHHGGETGRLHSSVKAKLHHRYPFSTIAVYNGSTIIHFVLGGIILCQTNRFFGSFGYILGIVYVLGSLLEMYLIMPLQVCRNCVYFGLENGRCVSGLNLLSKKLAIRGSTQNFSRRAEGLFCPNNIYLFSLAFPIIGGIPILVVNFSIQLLLLVASLFLLLIIRFFFIIPRLACLHCLSKFICPQAGQMGVRDK
jgi:hypothetical protein